MSNHVKTILVGVGATVTMDCWSFLLSLLCIKSQGLLFLGRWLACMPKRKFFHHTIIQTLAIDEEVMIGGIAHYCIGIAFAFLMVWMFGKEWLVKPGLIAATSTALVTLVAPIFIFQPAIGFGIAFSNLPQQSIL